MKLNQDHVALLNKVRGYMSNDAFASTFICTNIERMSSRMGSVAARKAAEELKTAIFAALNENSTLLIYLRRTAPGFTALTMHAQDEVARLGRLAWLDKMIETGEILPETC